MRVALIGVTGLGSFEVVGSRVLCEISGFRRKVCANRALLSFGTTYWSHLEGEMGPIGCPETSVRN